MAAPSQSAASSSSEDDDKEELDFLSPRFNPLKALFSPNVKVPFENVKSFTSVASYEAALKSKNSKGLSQAKHKAKAKSSHSIKESSNKTGQLQGAPSTSTKKENETASTSTSLSNIDEKSTLVKVSAERSKTGLAPGANVKMQRRRGDAPKERGFNNDEALRSYLAEPPEYDKSSRNVLTRMAYMFGPLELLTRCVMERLHVRVMTRAAVNVKSICRGYVVAFDKSFNIALIDVDEIYRRPVCLGKIRARRTHKLQAAQETLKKEREEQHKRFMSSNPWNESTSAVQGQGEGIAPESELTNTKGTKESEQVGKEKAEDSLAKLTKQMVKKSVYQGVPYPYSNYEREALMLGIPDENVEHRHINQMLIRGENVVLVSVIDD